MKKVLIAMFGAALLISACSAQTKTYDNADADVSFNYPASWMVQPMPSIDGAPYKQEKVSGMEGGVYITWGSGLGGACSENGQEKALEKMTLNGKQFDVCHTTDATGEHWGMISGTKATVDAYANPSQGRTLLQVLSTLKIN